MIMQITYDELKKVLVTIPELVTDTRCVEIKFGTKTIEVGKCRLHRDLDEQGKYKNAYYIFTDGEYKKIEPELNDNFISWVSFKVQNYIHHNGECDIFFNLKNYSKIVIDRKTTNINIYQIGEILRNTNQEFYWDDKIIHNEELKDLICEVDYLTYSFPFDFIIRDKFYQIGIGPVCCDIDENGIYYEHLYLQKDGKVIFLKDPDWVTSKDIDKLIQKINKNDEDIVLCVDDELMSGKQYWLESFSKPILKKIQKANEKYIKV